MAKELKLKVAEAVQDDVNKGIVRMDASQMRDIGIRPGDVVEVVGEKTTVAIAERAYPGDIGLSIVRMDGLMRRNAKTGIGEQVVIRPGSVKEAKKVVLAPARKDVVIKAESAFFKRGLLGRALMKGDIISLSSGRRSRKSSGSPFFEDIVELFDESMAGFGFSDLKFVVTEAEPKQAVKVTELTEVVYNPEAAESSEEEAYYPEITYEDIGGLQEEVRKIREMVEIPMKHPEVFDRLGIEAPKGVLIHGPPGTGKTLLAKAVANETNAHFININGPEIMSKFYGQSEENLRKKFEEAEKNAPAIIFIDELDAIASKREEAHGDVEKRVVAQLLAIMDGLRSRGKVVVIAATNIPNAIDPALRRPGRFDRELEISVPKEQDRLQILKVHTRNMPLSPPFNPVTAQQAIDDYSEKLRHDKESIEKELRSIKKDLKEKKEELKKINKQAPESSEEQEDSGEDAQATRSLTKQRERFSDRIEKLEERKSQKDKDKEQAEQKIEQLDNIRDRLNTTISSSDPERGLFGLSYVDIKDISESTTSLIVSKIKEKLNEADRPTVEHLNEVKSIKDLRQKVLDELDPEDPRKELIEKAIDEINIDLENFRFSKEGLQMIIPGIKDQVLRQYLSDVEKGAQSDDEVNEVLSASWINSELKERIRGDLVSEMLAWVAKITHGFVGADLTSLTKESAMVVLRRITSDLNDSEGGDITRFLDKLNISVDDFKESLKTVRPSALREVLVEIPKVKWTDVGGLVDVKQELIEAVEWPLNNPDVFKRFNVRSPKGIMLYGPPGTGKTMLAKAAAHEATSNFILVKGPEMLSKWVGESEKAVRRIFEKARQTSPVIIFLDEVDSIAPRRGASSDSSVTERVVNQLLTEMDGLIDLNDVVIIAATNRPDIVDTGLLRPGRFDRIIYVPSPDLATRRAIFDVHTQGMPLASDVSLDTLAEKTEGYTGADIESVCREGAMIALRNNFESEEVTMESFEAALKKVPASVTKEIEQMYQGMKEQFSSAQAKEMQKDKPAYFG